MGCHDQCSSNTYSCTYMYLHLHVCIWNISTLPKPIAPFSSSFKYILSVFHLKEEDAVYLTSSHIEITLLLVSSIIV